MPRMSSSSSLTMINGQQCLLIFILVILCVRQSVASNYFAYVHGKEPSKQQASSAAGAAGQPLTTFKAKLLRLCALYARGQRAQQRLIAMNTGGNSGGISGTRVGRQIEEAPQICRPVLLQMDRLSQQPTSGPAASDTNIMNE